MTVVAVTGGTGRIGAPLVRALVQSGQRVRALTRRPRPAEPGVEWVVGDLHNGAALVELMLGVDTVFHAAGQLSGDAREVERSLVDGTAGVLRAARDARVVHLSSLVVLHTASSSPAVIDESFPLERTPERRGSYTRAKVAAEQLVRAAAATQDVIIVRPGLVVDASSPLPLAVGWRRGGWVLLAGPGGASLPVVFADDVASGLLLAANRLPRGEILHLIDPAPMSRRALLGWLTATAPRRWVLDAGSVMLRLASLAAASSLPGVSGSAYRLLSAATPHSWSAAKAVQLGWHVTGDWRQRTVRSNQ
jgi:nucleoside-diphosphate-sugar epimerase